NFTFDFLNKFNQNLKIKKSLILSPFSIIQLFILLYLGSKNKTEQELKNFFKLSDKKNSFKYIYKLNQKFKISKIINGLNFICVPNYIPLNNVFISYVKKIGHFIKFDLINSKYETLKLNQIIKNSKNNS